MYIVGYLAAFLISTHYTHYMHYSSSHNDQKCLQMLLKYPWGGKVTTS